MTVFYKIDPFNANVTEHQSKLEVGEINSLIGSRMFTAVRLYANRDGAFIDDEGLFADNQMFWIHRNYPTPLAGIGIITGCDDTGETTSPIEKLQTVWDDIVFIGTRSDLVFDMTRNKQRQKQIEETDDYRSLYFLEAEIA
jgi:hypothetical protein